MKINTLLTFCLTGLIGFSSAAFAQDRALSEAGFQQWIAAFKIDAMQAGISSDTLEKSFADAQFNARVVELDQKQPESKLTHQEYLERVVPNSRVQKGKELLRKHEALLEKVSKIYGVQPEYIVALWGIESNFGERTGNFDVIESLATLAYEGRREKFFTKELINALKIIDNGHIAAGGMFGSWAGAMGQSQFMPSSFLAYAEDFNNDGRKDIWFTEEDVFASIANYLSEHGWDSRMDVLSTAGSTPSKTVEIDGLPVIVTPNYDVVLKWNRSGYFATAVGTLAEKIKG